MTDTQEILVNKQEYIDLKLDNVIFKAALQEICEQMPPKIKTALINIIKDIAEKALKQAK